jgi:uncharacterized repeat protein (TIGR02059 family)
MSLFMKILLSFIFIVICTTLNATDYYFSSSGNDANNTGLSESSPWQTISKVNSVFTSIKPGDRILFKRGDIFYGTIKVIKSGTSGSPITIGAYGVGEQPVITGFTTITGWSVEGNGIYSASVTSEAQTNFVTIDGAQSCMGRWPDVSYNIFESFDANLSITDTGLGDATQWTGAEVVIRKNDYSLDRCLITNHIGDKLLYTSLGTSQNAIESYGYFIQNDLRCLSSFGEWYHNPNSEKIYIYFGTVDPSTREVKVSTLNTLILNNGFDYITVDGVTFSGAISNTITYLSHSSNYCNIKNSVINFAGLDGIHFEGSYGTIDNNLINNCNQTGIQAVGNDITITSNKFKNIGLTAGQALQGSLCSGIMITGNGCQVQKNDIEYIGYCGIALSSTTDIITIKNNYINEVCLLLNDGGGIYTNGEGTDRIIDGNIILNSRGNSSGTPYPTRSIARGIYLDQFSSHTKVINNTVANCTESGYMVHTGHDNTFTDNISFNNANGIFFQKWTGGDIRNNVLNGNVFFAKLSSQVTLKFYSMTDDIPSFGSANNNYYARPLDDNEIIYTYSPSTGSKYRNLSSWQSLTNQDFNSKKSPIALTDTSDIYFYYNNTQSNKVISLSKSMVDVSGTKYTNSITLLPYRSTVLMVDPNPSLPSVPVYSGAVIEVSAPLELIMVYNLSLANIVPATGTFTVLVNGAQRIVNSVTISGTKVHLTLASPVVYNDVVTITYAKPADNPLQTVSGGQAASLSTQNVTNLVGAINPVYVSSIVENTTPSLLEMFYSLTLSNVVPAASAFSVLVNSTVRAVTSVAISGTKVLLTLSSPVVYGDIVSIAYSIPANNQIQTSEGGKAETLIMKQVVNNCLEPVNLPPTVRIFSPVKGSSFTSPATFTIDVEASDPDGSVSKVELFNGTVKIDERTTEPYSFTLKDQPEGTYELHAVATDNLKTATTSAILELQVTSYNENREFFNLYPNPNNGYFSINFTTTLEAEKFIITIVNIIGTIVYREEMSREEETRQFDLSQLTPGTYVLMITGTDILLTQKFIKG